MRVGAFEIAVIVVVIVIVVVVVVVVALVLMIVIVVFLFFEDLGRVVPEQVDDGGDLQGLVRGVLFDRRVDLGDELGEVDDVVGLFDGGDVAGGEFEIVRLLAGGREVGDVDMVASDLLGGEGQRVEGGDDVEAVAFGIRTGAAGGE